MRIQSLADIIFPLSRNWQLHYKYFYYFLKWNVHFLPVLTFHSLFFDFFSSPDLEKNVCGLDNRSYPERSILFRILFIYLFFYFFLNYGFSRQGFSGCLRTPSVDQANIRVRDPPASVSLELRLRECTTTVWLLKAFSKGTF